MKITTLIFKNGFEYHVTKEPVKAGYGMTVRDTNKFVRSIEAWDEGSPSWAQRRFKVTTWSGYCRYVSADAVVTVITDEDDDAVGV